MTIIDCLFYASDSLSSDVSWEYIAKLPVAWLYVGQETKENGFSKLFSAFISCSQEFKINTSVQVKLISIKICIKIVFPQK